MKKIEMLIECPSCEGTGVYVGMAERAGAAVVCTKCKGTGEYLFTYTYNDFTGRKTREDVQRVYLSGYGYVIAPEVVNYKGAGEIDMSLEGVSYDEFLKGKMPQHIKKLGCPMMADQGACHNIEGFTDRCNSFNDGWLSYIPRGANRPNAATCWKLFEEGK